MLRWSITRRFISFAPADIFLSPLSIFLLFIVNSFCMVIYCVDHVVSILIHVLKRIIDFVVESHEFPLIIG